MGTISIELVPRSALSLQADIALLKQRFPVANTLNIPDLLRFPLRSWDACDLCKNEGFTAIPHIRAMDFHLANVQTLVELLAARDLKKVLVIRGDLPADLSHTVHSTTSTELIRALKQAAPHLDIYAAFDPYRQSLLSDVEEAHEKLAAGACGLFTQPIFDLRFANVCADLLPDANIFWGVSPVISERSKSYWEVKNRAFFPPNFQPTLGWNRSFARDVLAWTQATSTSIYFMPIRVDLATYLDGVLP